MTSEDMLDRALKAYIKDTKGVDATSVWTDSVFERGWGGCNTCGNGGSEDSMTYSLRWSSDGRYGYESEEFTDMADLMRIAVQYSTPEVDSEG